MEFKFDAAQEHQLQAIEAVTRLFAGQPRAEAGLELEPGLGLAAVPNRLDLSDEALLENLRDVQRENEIRADDELRRIAKRIDTAEGETEVRFFNFSVEMETGTGKTYTYIRTALELFDLYGFRKFIIVVPSVAIREGVLKTFRMTRRHFAEHYDNVPYRCYAYDSGDLSQVRHFAQSDAVEFMVMTLASFNKDLRGTSTGNVIYRPHDRLQGETPVELVRMARPILILDEPQNMETEKSKKALAALNPLFALRYSATHRNPYNLVYRLSPYEAYLRGLVKRVGVIGIEEENANKPYVRLDEIRTGKRSISARITVHQLASDGSKKEKTYSFSSEDSLEKKTNNPIYAGYIVKEIDARDGLVRFENGEVVRTGEERGPDKELIFDAQIRDTIREHIRKQKKLRDRGIKVLSIFFIDKVANYADEDGVIRRLFNRAFEEMKGEVPEWAELDPEDVQAAYFASQRRRSGEVELLDSKTGEAQRDVEAYDLIMKDKEALLSFPSPDDDEETRRKKQVAFIFSHSALREGWDNPNVFQICTLNESVSEMRKRQEIGRGVRLAVNQNGERVHDEQVNHLTVIANESYEHFVAEYQAELDEEFGTAGAPPKPQNERKRKSVKLRKRHVLSDDFKELWERIKHKTRYNVRVDTAKLIEDVVEELDRTTIRPPRLVSRSADLEVRKDRQVFEPHVIHVTHRTIESFDGPVPNVVDLIAELMKRSDPPVCLTRQTLVDIFRGIREEKRRIALKNPYEFANTAAEVLKRILSKQLVDGIRYERIGEFYEMTQFATELEAWENNVLPAGRCLYDHVVFDSEVERAFAEQLERWKAVKLYVKLPAWFTVDTPIGTYNPDWAIVLEPTGPGGELAGKERLYLVRETKGSSDPDQLRGAEEGKITCAERHFRDALDVDYEVVTGAEELMEKVETRS